MNNKILFFEHCEFVIHLVDFLEGFREGVNDRGGGNLVGLERGQVTVFVSFYDQLCVVSKPSVSTGKPAF